MVLSVMNKLTTKSTIIEKECQWIKTDVLPEHAKLAAQAYYAPRVYIIEQTAEFIKNKK